MRWVFALLLLIATVTAQEEFLMERVEVTVSDIQGDGSAHVHESIKFIMFGDHANSLYDSAISNNKLSYWSNITGLKDVKLHISSSAADIRDFRLRPQPRTKCNPIEELCHGELILDYWAHPTFENNSDVPVGGTGVFTIDKYKPRTTRYTINPDALSFTKTAENNIVLEEKVFFIIQLPPDNVVLDLNPQPSEEQYDLPEHINSLSWEDIVLVKFSVVFDVEESIDKEVSDFFSSIAKTISDTLASPHGLPLVVLIIVVIGSYLYIVMAKRRGEE